MACLLVVHFAIESRMRSTARDHLYSFRDHGGHECIYLNLAVRSVPRWVLEAPVDLIIFHTSFLCTRWNRSRFPNYVERAAPLQSMAAPKIVIPQDDFINIDLLCDFIRGFGIEWIFTPAFEHDWATIYADVDRDRVNLRTVLTGYLNQNTISAAESFARRDDDRPLDIGYRARRVGPELGRHGILKSRIADVFSQSTEGCGLNIDISQNEEDTLYGDDWYRFLQSCKYTMGVEGGASLLDVNGSVHERTMAYLATHPQAEFEEVEQACFPGLDGNIKLFVISPRHLEACVTRTCQILIAGQYNDILKPDRHYLPLKRDFSNLDEVLIAVRSDGRRASIVEQAHEDIVASGRYTYRSFVDLVVSTSLGDDDGHRQPLDSTLRNRVVAFEKNSWRLVQGREVLKKTLRTLRLR